MNNKLFTIEGNIGAGKTTLINILKEIKEIGIVPEPVDDWRKLGSIGLFYSDPKRYNFLFQTHVLISRADVIHNMIKFNLYDAIIIERCGYADKECFIESNYELKNLNEIEYKLLLYMYDVILHKLYKDLYKNISCIYINTPPDICQKRTIDRNRKEDKGIDIEYLKLIDEKHKKLISSGIFKKILVIDGKIDYVNDVNNRKKLIEDISIFMNN